MGIVCGLLGGRPGMVNGATGAFAAIIKSFLAPPASEGGNGAGIELLFPTVVAAGIFMLLGWRMRLYRFISMLPASVMVGFCNGLAVVIGMSGQGRHTQTCMRKALPTSLCSSRRDIKPPAESQVCATLSKAAVVLTDRLALPLPFYAIHPLPAGGYGDGGGCRYIPFGRRCVAL